MPPSRSPHREAALTTMTTMGSDLQGIKWHTKDDDRTMMTERSMSWSCWFLIVIAVICSCCASKNCVRHADHPKKYRKFACKLQNAWRTAWSSVLESLALYASCTGNLERWWFGHRKKLFRTKTQKSKTRQHSENESKFYWTKISVIVWGRRLVAAPSRNRIWKKAYTAWRVSCRPRVDDFIASFQQNDCISWMWVRNTVKTASCY